MPTLNGATPNKTTVGRLVPFKKLKVNITSHQEGGALFCLRFEARRYTSQTEYEVVHSIQSNPMAVLSHSTQLKARKFLLPLFLFPVIVPDLPFPLSATSLPPCIQEVVPGSGSVNGGTKVAIIGSNFIDTPSVRVRFDSTDVVPTFHSGGTLICTTPQHAPATVTVIVSNDAVRWSDTSAKFTYEENQVEKESQPIANSISKEKEGKFQLPIDIARSVFEAAKEGGFDSVPRVGVNQLDIRGYALVHYVTDMVDSLALNVLIEQGANINLKDKHGNTPIFYTVLHGSLEMTTKLASAGANINSQNNDGVSPLHLAILTQNEKIAKYLIEHRALINLSTLEGGYSALHLAVAEKMGGLIQLLIKYGAHVNEEDDDGDTPLHWSVRQSDLQIAKQLLQYGADIFAVNEDEETPLDMAVALDEQIVAQVLFEQQQRTRSAAYYLGPEIPTSFNSEFQDQDPSGFTRITNGIFFPNQDLNKNYHGLHIQSFHRVTTGG
jgi:ankyrin repeat protein